MRWKISSARKNGKNGILRISLWYAIFATAWVSATNFTLDFLISSTGDPLHREHFAFEEVADVLQVIPATVLIFFLLRRELVARELISEAHRASEQRMSHLVETATDAIIGLDQDHRIFLFNRGAERTFGYEAAEVRGQPIDTLIPCGLIERASGSSGNAAQLLEIAARRKNGTEFLAEASFSEIAEDSEKVFTVILHDISQRKAAEEARKAAAQEERQRLARELHDSVSQALYGIGLGTHAAAEMIDRAPDRLKETLEYVRSLAQMALEEMRSIILQLRPSSLETEGLRGAITRLAETINAGGSMNIHLDLCPEPELSHDAKEAVYRICQEALHNATRHAQTGKVTLRLVGDQDQTVLEVIDDGIGFDATRSFPGHMGLESMRERASVFGGSLEIESAPGRGTRVRARIPTTDSPA